MDGFVLGLDLGQAQDYTGLVTIEQAGQRFDAVDIRRYPLGTPYPAIVEDVCAILARPLMRDAALVVDATGVGRPVVDMFRAAHCNPTPVLITAGAHAHLDENGYWLVPKKELVGA